MKSKMILFPFTTQAPRGGPGPSRFLPPRGKTVFLGPAGSSPAPWGRRCARGGGSNSFVRLVFCGTPERKTSTNTSCGMCYGRGQPSQLKARSDRRLDHRDKTVEHLETRARPEGRRTTRCSTDAYQLNRLRTAERPTGLNSTNDRCSLLYMNGCEL